MKKPNIALIDGDLWCYDIPFACESGDTPNFDYCITAGEQRMAHILEQTGCSDVEVYLTGSTNFRNDIATIKEYKAGRGKKPNFYQEMREWMEFSFNAQVIEGMEADDQLAIRQMQEKGNSVIVSRDKDLRMVRGWHYGYACGKQPEYAMRFIDKLGYLEYEKTCKGGGLMWFFAQLLMGDKTDNIQGVDGIGAKKAYDAISVLHTPQQMFDKCLELYGDLDALLENGNLLWMVLDLHPDGKPVMFSETDFCKELINAKKSGED
jgi:5'-3' exonuclease